MKNKKILFSTFIIIMIISIILTPYVKAIEKNDSEEYDKHQKQDEIEKNNDENILYSSDITSNFDKNISGILTDTTPPIIDVESITISNTNVTSGQKVKIAVKVTDDSGYVESVACYYNKPITQQSTDIIILTYNGQTGLFEKEIEITNAWAEGEYIIDYFYVSDGNNSKSYYNKNDYGNSILHSDAIDLSAGNFTVYGTTADGNPPNIDPYSLTVSSNRAIVGDTITYKVKITDESSIKSASMRICHQDGRYDYTYKTVNLIYNPAYDIFEGIVTIDTSFPTGYWDIYSITAIDDNNNRFTRYNSTGISSATTGYSNLSIATFKLFTDYPDAKYTNNSISINKNSFTIGETVQVSVTIQDEYGIDNVKIFYDQVNGPLTRILEANYTRTLYTTSVGYYKYTTDVYTTNEIISGYGYNGEWKVNRIEIQNIAGHITTFYNDSTNNLDTGNFSTYGLKDDSTPPVLEHFNIDKKIIDYNQMTKICIGASDDNNEIKQVLVNYLEPNNKSKNYILTQVDGQYEYNFNFDNSNKVGSYIANYILIEDISGNITKITDNIEDLNFICRNKINIIADSKFLTRNTSYNLKTIIYPTSEALNDVTWTSLDTSIASINSKTGILSTKNINGTVTIKATANDGSGLYDTITLIVSDSIVKVGQENTLGNSSYVYYKDVVWEIEDETILGKTGQTGFSSINNMYKHNIRVKGLKPGETILKILTPSGDILASSVVYVYDVPKGITSSYQEISLVRNERINLNAKLTAAAGAESSIIYTSENENVATVDSKGNVTGIGSGNTNIILYSKYYGVKLIIPVNVIVNAEEIQVDTEVIELNDDKKMHKIEYKVFPDEAIDKSVNFKSNNEEIALVSPTGLVSAQKTGSTTITITSKDKKIFRCIKVNVNISDKSNSIKGIYSCFGNDEDICIIQVIEKNSDKEIFKMELSGNNNSYMIPSVKDGNYIIRIYKKNHITKEYSVVVNGKDLTQNIEIFLTGDVNGDGKVSLIDYAMVLAHVKRTTLLTGEELERADVNGDGKISLIDYAMILAHVKRTTLLW